MNPAEMLHQMCHEVLSEADVKAICKSRGLPGKGAFSRSLLESGCPVELDLRSLALTYSKQYERVVTAALRQLKSEYQIEIEEVA